MTEKDDKTPKDPIKVLSVCINQGFYGDVTFKFRHGQVVHIVKAESIKLD